MNQAIADFCDGTVVGGGSVAAKYDSCSRMNDTFAARVELYSELDRKRPFADALLWRCGARQRSACRALASVRTGAICIFQVFAHAIVSEAHGIAIQLTPETWIRIFRARTSGDAVRLRRWS